MEPHEIRRWQLPGYSAFALGEPFPWVWAAFWLLWGLTVAALVVWNDGAYAVGGGFVAWGTLMGCFGWRALIVGAAIVQDWAKSHCTDPAVQMTAMQEMVNAVGPSCQQDEMGQENLTMLDTPVQRRWLQDELFTATCSILWFPGLIHGVAFGGLGGAALALVPGIGLSVTVGAMIGAIGGAATVTFLFAVAIALLPLPTSALTTGWSMRQRLLLVVSPLLAVPALIEAVIVWSRWLVQERSRMRPLEDS